MATEKSSVIVVNPCA